MLDSTSPKSQLHSPNTTFHHFTWDKSALPSAGTSAWPPLCWFCVWPQCSLSCVSCLRCWNLAYPAPHRSPGRRFQCLGRIWSPNQCVPGSQNQSFQYLRSYFFVTRTLAPGEKNVAITRLVNSTPPKITSLACTTQHPRNTIPCNLARNKIPFPRYSKSHPNYGFHRNSPTFKEQGKSFRGSDYI